MAKRKPKELVALLAGEGEALHDIKFFRGARELVSAHEIEEQVRSAHMQRVSGRAIVTSSFPDSGTPRIDVMELVSNL
jgi:hypothetical protein